MGLLFGAIVTTLAFLQLLVPSHATIQPIWERMGVYTPGVPLYSAVTAGPEMYRNILVPDATGVNARYDRADVVAFTVAEPARDADGNPVDDGSRIPLFRDVEGYDRPGTFAEMKQPGSALLGFIFKDPHPGFDLPVFQLRGDERGCGKNSSVDGRSFLTVDSTLRFHCPVVGGDAYLVRIGYAKRAEAVAHRVSIDTALADPTPNNLPMTD